MYRTGWRSHRSQLCPGPLSVPLAGEFSSAAVTQGSGPSSAGAAREGWEGMDNGQQCPYACWLQSSVFPQSLARLINDRKSSHTASLDLPVLAPSAQPTQTPTSELREKLSARGCPTWALLVCAALREAKSYRRAAGYYQAKGFFKIISL